MSMAPTPSSPTTDLSLSLASAKPNRVYRLAILIAAIGVFALAIGVALILRLRPQPSSSSDHLEARMTANSPENPVSGGAISPDGKYLAYSDATGLYLKLIRTGETH